MLRRAHAVVLALAATSFAACVVVGDLGSTGDVGSNEGGATEGGGTGEGGNADADTDGTILGDGGTSGPGALGALPSGFCCTSDSQCRYRHCLDSDAGRMCFDECRADTQWICDRPPVDLGCDLGQIEIEQVCKPLPGEPFACFAPSTFQPGTKATGECCTQREDGFLGKDCASNLCMSKAGGPFFCTRVCDSKADCPSGFFCAPQLYFSLCVPEATPYTCE